MGVGNFFGVMPESMQAAHKTGVELDSITARIAKKLYPDSTIFAKGFEETPLPDNYFDVAVGMFRSDNGEESKMTRNAAGHLCLQVPGGVRPHHYSLRSQSESSQFSNSTSRFHRGGLPGRAEGSTFSRALRLVSRLALA